MKRFRFILAWLVALSLSPAFGAQLTGGVNLHGVLPADVVGTTWQACGGVAAVTKKWLQGPLFQVIDHSGNTVTIYAKNGYPDVKKLAGLMKISPKIGISGLLSPTVYDQCGGGHNWTQGTTANQPAVWLVNGNVYLFFGGILSTNAVSLGAQYYNFDGTVTQNIQSASIFAVINPYSSGDSVGAAGTTLGAPTIVGSASGLYWAAGLGLANTNDGPLAGFFDFSSFAGPALTDTQITIQQSVQSLVLGPSAETLWLNETANTTGPGTAGSSPYSEWGNQPGDPVPGAFSGRQMALLVSGAAFTTTQAAQVRSALYQWANIKPLPSAGFVNLVIDGASIDQGQGGDPTGLYLTQNGGGYGWQEMIKDYLQLHGYAVQFNNMAASGATLRDNGLTYTSSTHTLYNSAAKKNVYFGFNSAAGNQLSDVGNFTASIASNVMTVTVAPSASVPLQVGQVIAGTGVTLGTTISSFGSGSGGTGTYNLSTTPNVGSEAMTNTATGLSVYNDFLATLALVKAQAWDVIVTYLFYDPGPSTQHDYNVLMTANAVANGIKVIQLQPSNNTSHNSDVHPTVIGYQGYYGNIVPQFLPMLFN